MAPIGDLAFRNSRVSYVYRSNAGGRNTETVDVSGLEIKGENYNENQDEAAAGARLPSSRGRSLWGDTENRVFRDPRTVANGRRCRAADDARG